VVGGRKLLNESLKRAIPAAFDGWAIPLRIANDTSSIRDFPFAISAWAFH